MCGEGNGNCTANFTHATRGGAGRPVFTGLVVAWRRSVWAWAGLIGYLSQENNKFRIEEAQE
ncbi:hypothetical protein E2C01_073331 [Portunus trituberculatus]|uniref:Uncharacterized protein n=1 Tax=Portunus trituberculatus TaxID=210409 RepID=A0A5B7I961_PORTR|nr:hypothetical protein [Portunus trituberculatus]